MQKTERLFLIVIILVGTILFYILFLFFDPQGTIEAHSEDPIVPEVSEMDVIEEDVFDNQKQFEISTFRRIEGAGGSAPPSFSSMEEESKKKEESPLAQRLRALGPALKVPLSVRQDMLRQTLIRRGYSSERFLQMQALAMEDQEYRSKQFLIRKLVDEGRTKDAIELLEEILEGIDEENIQHRAQVLEKLLEISLMAGDMETIDRSSKEYFLTLEKVVDVMKDTQVMRFHEAREKIYQLEKAIASGRRGSLMVFLHAMREGQLSPTELTTGMKIAAKNQSSEGPFVTSNKDIAAAEKSAYSFFKTYTK